MHRVLLVDDDADLRLLLQSALEGNGLKVLQAASALEAYDILKAEELDLLVVDAVLPDASGEEFISRCRADGFGGKIAYTSAFSCDADTLERLTQTLGVAFTLYKPVAPFVFARRILQLFGMSTLSSLPAFPTEWPRGGEFEELERSFADRLPQKLVELGNALHRSKTDSAALPEAAQLARRLRGTAGSYGHQDVGDIVGGIEDQLARVTLGTEQREHFWDELERCFRDALRCAQGPRSSATNSERWTKSQRQALLVIDEDIEFQRSVRTFARRHSLQVITAQNVEDGLESAGYTLLSAALVGLRPGGASPREVVGHIRSIPGYEELPIFFTSADGSLRTRVDAVLAGGARFLDKPLSEHRFSELLQQVPFREAMAARIVILDDDEIVLERYESDLRAAGYFVRGICDADELIDALDDVRPDVLLMDVDLGDVSGIDICRALRASDRWQFFPILMFSSDKDANMRVRAFQAGASDVLGKPLSVEELMMRVSVQAERIRLIHERSDRDSLSGLVLRRAFVEALQRSLSVCAREDKPLSLVIIDLDHFKQINDSHGHLMGDRVIAAFGKLLSKRFRLEDLRGRWGGEEFVLAFPGQQAAFARDAAERLLEEFSKLVFEVEGGARFSVTFTAGVAVYPADGEGLDLLVKRADDLLYEGKSQGRGRVVASPSALVIRSARD